MRRTRRRGLSVAIGGRAAWQGTRRAKKRAQDECVGPNPTDRAKAGTKKSLLVEGDGGPLGVVIAGANEVDHFLLEDTLLSVIVERPAPEQIGPEHLCLDAGYDNETGHSVPAKYAYTAHIRPARSRQPDPLQGPKYKPRRRVV